MDRGRSPSAGGHHLRMGHSASPHPLGPTFAAQDSSNNNNNNNHIADSYIDLNATSGAFNDPTFTQDYQQQAPYALAPDNFSGYQETQQHLHQPSAVLPSQTSNIADHTFLQSAQSAYDYSQVSPLSNHIPSTGADTETTGFPSFDFNQTNYDQNGSLDPSLLSDLDPNSLDLLSQQQQGQQFNTLDPSNFDMASTMQSHSPTPPHLLPGMTGRQSGTPSPHTSPSPQHSPFQSMVNVNRPRNTSESLDPSSAAFPQGNGNEWMSMGAYRGHRRSPSDQLSDISSHSNQASPYIGTLDQSHSSPMLNPSQDPAFNDGLGLGGFSLNEHQNFVSPGHSPNISPRLMPQQQALPMFTAENGYGLNTGMNGQYGQQQGGLEMFPNASHEPFPSLNQGHSPSELGAADQMSPPEISIDYAPPNQQNHDVPRPLNAEDTLSPPLGTGSRNRIRAKSESHAGSRPSSPSVVGRGRAPSLQHQTTSDSLSPFDGSLDSRSPSPGQRGRNGSLGRQRSSSNASDHRDYILDLANPERTPSNGAESRRQQKHPATFQCHLCPKRFTRAYNLRSHLRTHTDERPFVCTVCGKAFARQHDRKRHEGLHSGEKKFVCRGTLSSGSQWGCGRRFARADALGRHFRSEAGRVCIKPLLDEEAAEREKAWMQEQQQAQVAAGLVAPQPMLSAPQPVDMLGSFLPAALLQQYPALAGIDWSSIPQGNPPPEEEYSGRSSFDASSGGELYEDYSENEMGNYPPPGTAQQQSMGMNQQDYGMNAVQQQQQQQQQGMAGAYGNQAGDYMDGFEGR